MENYVSEKLTGLNDLFKGMTSDQKPKVKSNGQVPDGDYSVTIISTKLIESKNGTPQYLWILRIDEGEYEDCILEHRNSLTSSEKSIDQLIKDLKKCDVTLVDLIELSTERIQKELEGKRLLVKVEKTPYFYNTLFMKGL